MGTRFAEELGGSAFVVDGEPEEIVIHRIRVRRALSAPRLGAQEFVLQSVGEARNDFVLHVEEIGDRLVEPLGPEVAAGLRRR